MISKTKKIAINGIQIAIIDQDSSDYISLTDMLKNRDGDDHIRNWMRNRNTVEFLGIWETMHNPDFKGVEFDTFRKEAGLNKFNLTPKKWIEATNAIGLVSKAGKTGGTFAHVDIAFEFASWLSVEFKLLLIKEFQRLKSEESKRREVGWDVKRFLAKVNYHIQTDSIKENLIPISELPKDKQWIIYAEEADIINMAVFGLTAKQWKDRHPKEVLNGFNMRDLADVYQLNVVANLEAINAKLIREGIDKENRFLQLRSEAVHELKSLYKNNSFPVAIIQSPFSTPDASGSFSAYEEIKENEPGKGLNPIQEIDGEPLSEFNKRLVQAIKNENKGKAD